MKKRTFVMIARVLAVVSLLGVFAFQMVGYAKVSDFKDVPMQYFDEQYTIKKTETVPSPLIFAGGFGGDAFADTNSRQLGVFQKAADDASFMMKSMSNETTNNTDYAANFTDGYMSPVVTFNEGEKLVISFDAATSSKNSAVKGLQFRASAGTDSTYANKWPMLAGFKSDGSFSFASTEAETDAKDNGFTGYDTGRWYNFTLVIYGYTNRYDVYIDGVKAVDNKRLLFVTGKTDPGDVPLSITQFRPSIKTVAGADVDLFIDNLVVYDDNRDFSLEQYKANADAANLSFARDMKNANADASNVTSNLTLPTTGYNNNVTQNNSTITWSSSKPSIIATDGTVTRDIVNQTVTLTATVTNGSDANQKTQTKKFTVTVSGAVTVPGALNIANKALTINGAAFSGTATYAAGDTVKISADIANLGTGSVNANFIIAAYKNNELVGVTVVPKPIGNADTDPHNQFATYVLPEGDYTGVTFKGMIWSDNMMPYCSIFE